MIAKKNGIGDRIDSLLEHLPYYQKDKFLVLEREIGNLLEML